MIEGLWVVRFLGVGDPSMDLNGGVVVIETGRVLGGDSGYYYVGNIDSRGRREWDISLTVRRHDPNIKSIFGDVDTIDLKGSLFSSDPDAFDRATMLVSLTELNGEGTVEALLIRVSDLP